MSKNAAPRRADQAQIFRRATFGVFALTAISQIYLQVFERADIVAKANGGRVDFRALSKPATRGSIFDSAKNLLAEDEVRYQIRLTPVTVPHTESFFVDLSVASGIPASEIASVVEGQSKKATLWDDRIGEDQANLVRKVKKKFAAKGLELVQCSTARNYPLAEMTASVVGGVWDSIDHAPRLGLELSQDSILAGPLRKIPVRSGGPSEPVSRQGEDLTLTLDPTIQKAAYEALAKAVKDNHADGGAAVVIDPRTGDILALVSAPFQSPNVPLPVIKESDRTKLSPMVNLATQQRYEPGSTFKILTVALALDLGVATDMDVVMCNGALPIGKSSAIHCESHGGHSAHGPVAPRVAIAKSCNVAAATWALRIGYDEYLNFMDQAGLSSPANIGMPGEVRGYYLESPPNVPLQLANIGFGQAVSTNPVSLCSAFSAIGNKGERMEPRLIAKIGDVQQPARSAGELFTNQTSDRVLSYMHAVMTSGTGKSLNIEGYDLGGKTGTAQKVGQKGASGNVANFVGFVPAKDPKATILVMVDNPKGVDIHGASVAGPAFRAIAHAVIDSYGIARNK